jgi:hypothetical protein
MIALAFTSDWIEAIELVVVLAAAAAGARIIFCHQQGCYRIGRFRHGHYKLCHVHHPNVPSDGRITEKHIKEVK